MQERSESGDVDSVRTRVKAYLQQYFEGVGDFEGIPYVDDGVARVYVGCESHLLRHGPVVVVQLTAPVLLGLAPHYSLWLYEMVAKANGTLCNLALHEADEDDSLWLGATYGLRGDELQPGDFTWAVLTMLDTVEHLVSEFRPVFGGVPLREALAS